MKQFLIKLYTAIAVIFAPVQSIMLSALALIAADLITGVMAARKRGEKIKSSGLRRTIVKILVYEIAIGLGFIAQHYLMMDVIPIANIIGSYVGLTELVSVYENIDKMSGGQLLKSIIDRLKSANDKKQD